MRNEQARKVRLERRPHRDAVRRLRKAYGLLWRLSPPAMSTGVTAAKEGIVEKAHSVQEVQQ